MSTEQKRRLIGAMHTVRRRPIPARWPYEDGLDVVSTLAEVEPGRWMPSRPLTLPGLRKRLAAAWGVVRGRAAAVEWR